jgi:glutamate-1-semialdehyde 2,1-aminomutase
MSIIGEGVAQGGTYTNNKAGVAAAHATLRLLKSGPVLKQIAQRGQRLMDGLREIFEENGIEIVMNGYPAMFAFQLGAKSVTSQREFAGTDLRLHEELTAQAIRRGVMPDYDAREPWFLCAAHSDEDVDRTLTVYAEIVKQARH